MTLTKGQVVAALDKAFAPDVRVKVDEQNRIRGFELCTLNGVLFSLSESILERDIDRVLMAAPGIVFEIEFEEEVSL